MSSKRSPDWLRQRSRPVRGLLGRSLAASLAGALALCAQAGLLAWALNAAIFERRPWRSLLPALLGFAALALARLVAGLLARHYGFVAGRRQVAALRQALLEKLQALGPAWLARQSSGHWVTQLVEGCEALEGYYARYLPQLAAAALLPLVILAAVFPADWLAGLVLALTAPLVPVFMILLGQAAERASQKRWTVLSRLGAHFTDLLAGLLTLRLNGAGERAQALLAMGSERYRRDTMAVLRVAFLSSLVLEFFATVSIAVVAVLVGFRLLWGDAHFGAAMFVLLLAPEFYLPLRGLGALRHVKMDALAIATEAQALLDLPVDPRETSGRPPARIGKASVLRLDALDFHHADGRGALHQVTLRLPAGQITALVGPSGSGKSTLVQLLLGLLKPAGGAIVLDDQPLADAADPAWRSQLAWVPQRPQLFLGSLRDNVCLGTAEVHQAALDRAARQAGLEPVLARLPQGWDTPLGEHGYGLSGGEAQRVALARALLREAPLLILDEPTQQLDAQTAMVVQRALRAAAEAGRMVLQVSHRMAQVAQADQVVVLQQGRVVEQGRPAQLCRGGGLYARLLAADGMA